MLKNYRLKAGMTQERLADVLDISWRQLQRIESGRSLPSLATLRKMIIVLNITPEDVVKFIKAAYKN